MRRLLTLGLLVAGLLVLMAAPVFAADGETPPVVDTFAAIAVTIGAAALIVQKVVERLKSAFDFLHGTRVSVVAIGLGFAAAYGFDLTVGATGSEFIDKLFAALTVGLGAGTIDDVTE